MQVRRLSALAALMVFSASAPAQTALGPNTQQLSVSRYVYFNPSSGNYERYNTVGFYEPAVGALPHRVALMPRFSVGGVNFISKTGTTLPADDATANNTRRIRVSLRYDGDMPNESQRRAVLGQIFSQPVEVEPPPAMLFRFAPPGQPMTFLDSVATPQERMMVEQGLQPLLDKYQVREQLAARWAQVKVSVAPIQAVRFTLLVDGEKFDERQIASTMVSSGGTLPDLFINDVTEYQLNRVKEGAYQVMIEFAFLDTSVGSINANFQMDRVMKHLVEESQRMTASAQRSGVQILGFGSRRTRIQQTLREQSKEQIQQDAKAGTTIEMRDASPALLQMFESKFFPALSQAQAIQNHLAAGEAARSAGKDALAKAHFGYAEALQKNDIDLSVDTDAALKSLQQKDYAGFVAKGVKVASNTGTGSAEYTRVLSREAEETAIVDWTAVQTVSVQRVVTQYLQREQDEYVAALGICDLVPYRALQPNGPPEEGIVPICVVQGGPAAMAGIRLGEFLGRIGGRRIRAPNDLKAAMAGVTPGDPIQVERLTWKATPTYVGWVPSNVKVVTSRAPKP